MPTTLKDAVVRYLRSGSPAIGTRKEYFSTLRKWTAWGGGATVEKLPRREIRDFLDWVYERAVEEEGIYPSRTANKPRENLQAIMSWAWKRDIIDVFPRFPKPMPQRSVAGRHYLTKAEINALYFAGGGARPNARFQSSCELAGIKPKANVETGEDNPWLLKDLRKTCATYYNEHLPESSIEILGHSVGGVTYRHHANRVPLAFKAIMTLSQPPAFAATVNGFEGQCPCCRRRFSRVTVSYSTGPRTNEA